MLRLSPRMLLAMSMLMLLVVTAAKAARGQAAPFISEIKLGILSHDTPGLWSGFRLERGIDINGEVAFGQGLQVLGGAIQPVLGGSWNTSGGTSRAYGDLRWQWETPSRIFFAIGLGAAVHNGVLDTTDPQRKALGGRVLFHVPVEIGYRFDRHQSLSLYFEHISNANSATRNEGLDAIGVRYGYKF